VFGCYASSICITVVLVGFLAILFDPLVVKLERLHIARSVAAASIVLVGIGLIGLLGYVLYGRAMSFAEELPVYASKIQQTIEPISRISRKIQNFQQSAGTLTNDVHPTRKVPEVRLQESPTWPDYLVRGVGSVWGALIIAGVVPFLTFFMLCTKDQMAIRTNGLFSSRIDAARFITNLNQMIHGFVAGNLIVGSVMALATTLVLWAVGVRRCQNSHRHPVLPPPTHPCDEQTANRACKTHSSPASVATAASYKPPIASAPASHIPHEARGVRLRCLDVGTNCRT